MKRRTFIEGAVVAAPILALGACGESGGQSALDTDLPTGTGAAAGATTDGVGSTSSAGSGGSADETQSGGAVDPQAPVATDMTLEFLVPAGA